MCKKGAEMNILYHFCQVIGNNSKLEKLETLTERRAIAAIMASFLSTFFPFLTMPRFLSSLINRASIYLYIIDPFPVDDYTLSPSLYGPYLFSYSERVKVALLFSQAYYAQPRDNDTKQQTKHRHNIPV